MDAAAGLFFSFIEWWIALSGEVQVFLGMCLFVLIVMGLVKLDEVIR